MDIGRALVLGGGGVTGIAWETGLILGLAEAGVDMSDADVVVGTSAGASVAAAITSGRPLLELFEAQIEGRSREIVGKISPGAILRILLASAAPGDQRRAMAWLGQTAVAAKTVAPEARREVIARRLPTHEWPACDLRITAIDAESGELTVFDRASGVSLVDAVAASCAVPGVWPAVTINGRTFIDGGSKSAVNADLVRGARQVVVIAPQANAIRRANRAKDQIRQLGSSRSLLVTPDADSRAAMGRSPLDPSHAAAASRAGRTQGGAAAAGIRGIWT